MVTEQNPCIEWYKRRAGDRWRAAARATLTTQLHQAATDIEEEGYLLALEQVDSLPAPVDVGQFARLCNERAVQFYPQSRMFPAVRRPDLTYTAFAPVSRHDGSTGVDARAIWEAKR